MKQIGFRMKSERPDYVCHDGELQYYKGATVSTGGEAATGEGSVPNPPEVTFSIVRSVLAGWHIHPDMAPSRIAELREPNADGWGAKAIETLEYLRYSASRSNLFVFPFYALAAWRLNDGSIICQNEAQLLKPNATCPLIAGTRDFEAQEMELKVLADICKLQWRFGTDNSLRQWTGKIKSLMLTVSGPLKLYDPTLPPVTLRDAGYPIAWLPMPRDGFSEKGALGRLNKFYTISEIPFESLTTAESGSDVEFTEGSLSDCRGSDFYTPAYLRTENPRGGDFIQLVGTGEKVELTTRPLKLDEAEEWKRLRAVSLRGAFKGSDCKITVYGSRNLCDWQMLKNRERATSMTLYTPPFRFFKISVSLTLGENETLQGLALDY